MSAMVSTISGGLVLLVIGLMLSGGVMYALTSLVSKGTCRSNGCGHNQFGNDDRCAICRLPLD
jgi:hypothetical protein